ncbi:hypothetical protein COX84_02860 [Candidatus Micrarchaeota archaeon CG_4_10_14_0_2_um_filter_49_7]|nr:MAG: hypothetical protein COX84_02860 [Candidatus Micrarchaeota archaeon CG_4_10_14_0_2_um_filter_49_7]
MEIPQVAGLDRAKYFDIIYSESTSKLVSLKDGKIESESINSRGFACRVLNNAYGFCSTNAPSKKNVFSIVGKAIQLSLFKSGNAQESIAGRFQTSKQAFLVGKKNVLERSLEEDIAFVRDLAKQIKGKVQVVLRAGIGLKSIGNVNATREQTSSRVHLSLLSSDGSQQASESIGAVAGYEKLESAYRVAEELNVRLENLKKAKPLKKGKYTVIIDPKLAGVLAHEAMGHASEADAVIANDSILKDMMGKSIAPESISITDSPHLFDSTAYGSYAFDDEGMDAQETIIVQDGIVNSYLHSLYTSTRLGAKSTGNARRQDYSCMPIVRMSNTYFRPGEARVEELFEGVSEGLYLKGMRGGSVEPLSGNFIFAAQEGFLIKNGEIGEPVLDAFLAGNIKETLFKIDLLANDFGTSVGRCGKAGQSVPVSDGGPHMRIREMRVG